MPYTKLNNNPVSHSLKTTG